MLSKSQLVNLIDSTFIDNTSGLISALDQRTVLTEMVNSEANLITNNNLLGLGEWDSTFTYSSGGCAVVDYTIYQCIVSSSTVGSFIGSQWVQIKYDATSTGLFLEKSKGIELNENKIIPTIATDTSFTSATKTGFYKIQAITAPTGLNQEYPEIGKGLLSVYKSVAEAESLLFYYPYNDQSHYYIKVANGNWNEFKTAEETDLTYTNGIVKAGDEITLGGNIDNVTLTGNAVSNFTVQNVNTITLQSGYNKLQGTTGIIGNVDITGKLNVTGEINFNGGNIVTVPDNLNITKNNTNVQNLNVNGFTGLANKASYTVSIYPHIDSIDLNDIPNWDIVKKYVDSSGAVDISYVRTAPTKVTVGGLVSGSYPSYTTMQELFDAILYPFTVPTISLTSSSLHEKGLTINKSMNYGITLNDGIVVDRKIYLNTVFEKTLTTDSGTYNSTSGLTWANAPSPSVLYYAHTFNFRVNFTNTAQLNSAILVEFASPSYYGVLASGSVSEANVKALTKRVRKKANDSLLNFNPTLQRYVYAYPTVYGDLASIIDQNGFNVTSGFTKSTATYTLADSTTESYNVYVSNTDTTQVNFKLNFNF